MSAVASSPPPRWRIVVTWILFVQALVAAVTSAAFLSELIAAWSPLDPRHAGPYVPMFTRQVLEGAADLPLMIGVAAGLAVAGAAAAWRSRWRIETRMWVLQAIAFALTGIALVLFMQFVAAFFLLPKIANAALEAGVG